MAHDMYDISELLKKYPLVKKLAGGDTTASKGSKTIIEAIDQNIDGTDREKQALIISAFYSMSSEAMECGRGHFGRMYGPETEAVMEDIFADHEKTDRRAAYSENTSRIHAVMCIYMLDTYVSDMKEVYAEEGHLPHDGVQELTEFKHGLLAGEKKFLTSLNAPRLEALYQTTKQNFLATLDSLAAPVQPKNRKKPNTPPSP